LIVLMANGVAVQGINFLVVTMIGDIIDYDELLFGKRREALYGSLLGWFEKAGGSIGTLLCGFLLVWIGFSAKTGAQSPHTLELMKYFYFLFPFIGAIFAILAVNRYELTEDRAYEIRDELNRRHADRNAAKK
jgi:GPH family glycoside/pentoside/hexuronide:cation symporter